MALDCASLEETPVTDVRRVRERLSAEFRNDPRLLAQHAEEVAARLQAKLGLRPVTHDHERPDASK